MPIVIPPPRHTLVAGISFRVVLVFAMALPMLVLYAVSTLGPLLGRDLRFEPASLGYLVMSSFGLAAILSPWAGAIVDRIGSRYALIGLFSVIALAFALIATAETFQGLVVATALCGIAQALANPATNLLIAQQVPPEKKAKSSDSSNPVFSSRPFSRAWHCPPLHCNMAGRPRSAPSFR